ncbi:DUF3021 domain-containing protein [Staphylococcus cohnii]|uniref:DUF3021 domain-containing protein n=1 Tax=Staphylococcus ureilyticus TaxID=94138 RepID=UPI0011AA6174
MKRILKEMLQGVGFSSSITIIFLAANHMSIGFGDVLGIYFFGAVCGLLSSIYVVESIPLLLQLFIHLSGSVISFIVVAYLNHWLPMEVSTVVSSITIFVIIFLILWLIFFINNLLHSKKVNAQLKK